MQVDHEKEGVDPRYKKKGGQEQILFKDLQNSSLYQQEEQEEQELIAC